MQIYENSQDKSISSLIENYYSTKNETRKQDFIQTTFGTNKSKQDMISAANQRLKNSIYMVIWRNEENINLNDSYDKAIVNKLIELFIDFITE